MVVMEARGAGRPRGFGRRVKASVTLLHYIAAFSPPGATSGHRRIPGGSADQMVANWQSDQRRTAQGRPADASRAALRELGIGSILAYSPQAIGRIEQLFDSPRSFGEASASGESVDSGNIFELLLFSSRYRGFAVRVLD